MIFDMQSILFQDLRCWAVLVLVINLEVVRGADARS